MYIGIGVSCWHGLVHNSIFVHIQCTCVYKHIMWQSWVEIEHYSASVNHESIVVMKSLGLPLLYA